ncbi:MAG: hypothetical protein RDU20_02255 [Desulfomonilaceae bacterium]|nr:hypothetical protein [Desulfomonilaceae bacterium]
MKFVLLVSLIGIILIILLLRSRKPRPAVAHKALSAGPGDITSRYAEAPDVVIDPMKVPEDLRDLVPLAKKWAIGDDVERAHFRDSVPATERRELIDMVSPKWDRLEQYCAAGRNEVPVPDEVVLFDMMAEAASEIWPEFPDK